LSIPVERISAELLRILGNNDNGLGIKLLHNSGLLQDILPEVAALDTTDNGRHKNNYYHTIEVYQNISRETQNPWLRLAALLHDIGKERCKKYNPDQCTWTFFGHPEVGGRMVEDIFKRLRLSREKMEYVKKLVRLHMRPQKIADTGVTDSAVRRVLVEAGDDIWDLLLLSRCDVTTKHSDKKARMQETIDILEQKIKELQVLDWRREFQPCVNGKDIMELYNIKGGPLVGYLKDSIKEAVLDGEIPNERETIINYLNTLYENYKNNPNIITGMA
jgi:putative nucleotidyltransferase with HDIG domain